MTPYRNIKIRFCLVLSTIVSHKIKVFLECIIIPKSLSAVGAVSLVNVKALSNNSNYKTINIEYDAGALNFAGPRVPLDPAEGPIKSKMAVRLSVRLYDCPSVISAFVSETGH